MNHGDISNERDFAIGVRFENCLLKYKDNSFKDSILNLLVGKVSRAEVDNEVFSLMKYLYYNTSMTVVLIINQENYTKSTKKFLENFPFNQVGVVLKSQNEITTMLNTGELTYFIASDPMERESTNSRYAVSPQEFNSILKRAEVRRF